MFHKFLMHHATRLNRRSFDVCSTTDLELAFSMPGEETEGIYRCKTSIYTVYAFAFAAR